MPHREGGAPVRAAAKPRTNLPESLGPDALAPAQATDTATPPSSAPRSRRRQFAVLTAQIVVIAGVIVGALNHLFGFPGLRDFGVKYRIDLDVYRLGGTLFRDGITLYGSMPPTAIGTYLPFTYPPLSAALFSPLSYVSLNSAIVIVTAISIGALAATVVVTLRSLGYESRTTVLWGTLGVLALVFAVEFEPVQSTLNYGQINMILMALVTVDVLAKNPWLPRGTLIGIAAAIKLTPAVFVLYFLVRKDFRAAVMSGVGFLVATAIGYLVASADSVKYWTTVLPDSNRIGNPGYPANQSVTGMLTRLGVAEEVRSSVWLALSIAAAALVAFAMWRALRADQPALALSLNAILGLLASPVSWSHHWVWAVPLMVTLAALSYQCFRVARAASIAAAAVVVSGLFLMWLAPHWRLGQGRWNGKNWPLLDQFFAASYVWWALAAVVVAIIVATPRMNLRGADEQALVAR
ncbi:MAG: DUF2029 domain-containing protein [Rhodococcus sp.]|nr:DUF2029 domain-containing protein [Rhodococcus sp. (in: high G+C Gram-positive bacteria)]